MLPPPFLSFVLLAVAALAAPPAAPGPEARGAGADAEQADEAGQRMLDLHNRERALFRVTPLEWDAGLARSAAASSAEIARSGRLAVEPPERRPLAGENVWMGRHEAGSLDHAIADWAAGKSLFRPGRFPDVSTTGRWRDVAQYTQMVWPGTSRIGCAKARASGQDIWVCYYSPGGNVVGHLML